MFINEIKSKDIFMNLGLLAKEYNDKNESIRISTGIYIMDLASAPELLMEISPGGDKYSLILKEKNGEESQAYTRINTNDNCTFSWSHNKMQILPNMYNNQQFILENVKQNLLLHREGELNHELNRN